MIVRKSKALTAQVHASLVQAHAAGHPLDAVLETQLASCSDRDRVTLFAGDVRSVVQHTQRRQRVQAMSATAELKTVEPPRPPMTISRAVALLILAAARRLVRA